MSWLSGKKVELTEFHPAEKKVIKSLHTFLEFGISSSDLGPSTMAYIANKDGNIFSVNPESLRVLSSSDVGWQDGRPAPLPTSGTEDDMLDALNYLMKSKPPQRSKSCWDFLKDKIKLVLLITRSWFKILLVSASNLKLLKSNSKKPRECSGPAIEPTRLNDGDLVNPLEIPTTSDLTKVKYIHKILDERARQDKKWGEQNHSPALYALIMAEESGEVCKAAVDYQFSNLAVDKVKHRELYKMELIQTAAVCLAALECLDREDSRG